MGNHITRDTNVALYSPIMSPREMSEKYPATDEARGIIYAGRAGIENILDRKDERKIIILGPCSIHNIDEAIEYAEHVRDLSEEVGDKFNLVMRTYFEKPRTVAGWRGLISDPYLDGSDKMEEGLSIARELLLKIANMGVPVGTEFLDPIVPSYLGELVSWAAIGARTTESQTHRQMASGLSMPVGFKNGTSGETDMAINAIKSATQSSSFFGVNPDGVVSQVETKGNPYGHLILRGGDKTTNYDSREVSRIQNRMVELGVSPNVIIDCSHGNSNKDYSLQPVVFDDVVKQIASGNNDIMGVMLESNLNEGSQKIPVNGSGEKPKKGVSVTDGCMGWDQTRKIILGAHKSIS